MLFFLTKAFDLLGDPPVAFPLYLIKRFGKDVTGHYCNRIQFTRNANSQNTQPSTALR